MSKEYGSILWVSFAMCVGVMGTALASPLYPLYHEAWHLQPSHITGIYVAYILGVLFSLLFLARLTDRLGFMPMLRAGLILVTAGLTLSTLAWNLGSLVLSRVVIGMASGLITTSSAVGLMALNQYRDPQQVSALTSLAMACGFGAGPLIGGIIAQWAPEPLVTTYIPNLVLGLMAILGLFYVKAPQHSGPNSTPFRIRELMPRVILPAASQSRPFWLAGMAAFSAFGIFGLYASLAPNFMEQMLPWHGPAISGASIALILVLSATTQWFARRFRPLVTSAWGMAAMCMSCLALLATTYTESVWAFVVSMLLTSVGHGLANLSGIGIINRISTSQNRAGLFSSYLMVGYLGSILPILALGWISDHFGLRTGIGVFCLALATLTFCLMGGAIHIRRVYYPVPASA